LVSSICPRVPGVFQASRVKKQAKVRCQCVFPLEIKAVQHGAGPGRVEIRRVAVTDGAGQLLQPATWSISGEWLSP